MITLDSGAQLIFKAAALQLGEAEASWRWVGMVAHSALFWAAVLCLSLSFPIWMLILRRTRLHLAFPATALTYVGVIAGSHWLFGEVIRVAQFIGIVLIVLGIAMMRTSSE